jgi:hypothetical protein
MHAQETADFGAFGFIAFAARKSFQTCRRTVLGIGRFVPNNFRTEELEKLHKGIDVAVHDSNYRDAAAAIFCKIFGVFFSAKNSPRVKCDILQKNRRGGVSVNEGACVVLCFRRAEKS